ncbi:phage baseplate assembly protein V [Marinomonas atlantica]|uniref:phage baseplate assembly protein V n=1 Tax=Marinomonas atlantica TaxID=1806668 RepID=UPI00082B2682|nr:phage baseplate assembly protein V [Marinomonas atlantica]
MSEIDFIVRDLQRRLANMIRRGTIHSVDFESNPPLVKVEYKKDVISGWLPWVAGRVGHAATWEPIKVGEPVLILSESGEMSAGVVLPSFPSIEMSLPDNKATTHVTRYEDGTTVTYDREAHKLTVDVVGSVHLEADDKISVQCKKATVNADQTIKITAGSTITADGSQIKLNGGTGVVTGAHICMVTGKPHGDCSSTVTAGK